MDAKQEERIPVAAHDFTYAKWFSPFPRDISKQEYIKFEKGDRVPDDIVERCRQRNPEMIKFLTLEEIDKVKQQINDERYGRKPVKIEPKNPEPIVRDEPVKPKTLEDYPSEKVDELRDLKKKEQEEILFSYGLSKGDVKGFTETARILKILELKEKNDTAS